MFTIDVKVGRLLEVRASGVASLGDTDAGRDRMIHLFRSLPGKLVVCADLSRSTTFPPEVASKVVELFRQDNPNIERSGILVSESAIFGLQLERLVNQAGNPNRRCFRDTFELKAFLGAVLKHEEHIRLAQFLAEK